MVCVEQIEIFGWCQCEGTRQEAIARDRPDVMAEMLFSSWAVNLFWDGR
jgi:hypothetical protein